MTVFQLKQAIEGYTAQVKYLEQTKPKDMSKERKQRLTRYRSLLRTAEFTLQRKQDAQAVEFTPSHKKAILKRLKENWASAFTVPFNEERFNELVKVSKTFIQNYNS